MRSVRDGKDETAMNEMKLGILEKCGDADVQELVSEVRRLRAMLRELSDAAEEMASSDADMPSHDATEYRFDQTLAAAKLMCA